MIKRNEKGYPLDENGDIDWEQTSKEKQQVLDQSLTNGELDNSEYPIKKIRKKNTHLIPKKKKRK